MKCQHGWRGGRCWEGSHVMAQADWRNLTASHRTSGSFDNYQKLRWGKEGLFPKGFRESLVLRITWVSNFGFESPESFFCCCCFKPLSLCLFLLTALGNECLAILAGWWKCLLLIEDSMNTNSSHTWHWVVYVLYSMNMQWSPIWSIPLC